MFELLLWTFLDSYYKRRMIHFSEVWKKCGPSSTQRGSTSFVYRTITNIKNFGQVTNKSRLSTITTSATFSALIRSSSPVPARLLAQGHTISWSVLSFRVPPLICKCCSHNTFHLTEEQQTEPTPGSTRLAVYTRYFSEPGWSLSKQLTSIN